jgi:hypothetical protein
LAKNKLRNAFLVPPTLDPMRLDIGNIYDWFRNPLPYQVRNQKITNCINFYFFLGYADQLVSA